MCKNAYSSEMQAEAEDRSKKEQKAVKNSKK
jgi:hypothetical protein